MSKCLCHRLPWSPSGNAQEWHSWLIGYIPSSFFLSVEDSIFQMSWHPAPVVMLASLCACPQRCLRNFALAAPSVLLLQSPVDENLAPPCLPPFVSWCTLISYAALTRPHVFLTVPVFLVLGEKRPGQLGLLQRLQYLHANFTSSKYLLNDCRDSSP